MSSMLNSFKTLGIILGCTIIFSIIPNTLITYIHLPETFKGIIVGLFELTNGIKMLSSATLNVPTLLCITSFILSFSSIMIIFQIYTFVSNINIKLPELIAYKLLHGGISTTITYILLKFNIFNIELTKPTALNTNNIYSSQFSLNTMYILIILITLALLYLTLKKKR